MADVLEKNFLKRYEAFLAFRDCVLAWRYQFGTRYGLERPHDEITASF